MSQQCVPVYPNLAASQGKGQQDKTTLSEKIKPLKGHVFGRTTVGRKLPLFLQEKHVRATSLGQLFVISIVGLHLHLQI